MTPPAAVPPYAAPFGVPPQETTTALYQAIQEDRTPPPPAAPRPDAGPIKAALPSFLQADRPVERPVFVAREDELARLERHLDAALAGRGRVVFVTGNAGSGKTALIQEFTHRMQILHHDLVVSSGNCNAYTGVGDPYLPFRQILELLAGDVRAQWAAGAMTTEHARRLWNTLPYTAQVLAKVGPDLIDTFVPGTALLERAVDCAASGAPWLARLRELLERKSAGPISPGPQQTALFEQYTRVLQGLAPHLPLLLVLDDLQWADAGSIHLLFHLGRRLAGSRILVVGAYRPEEVAIGRDGERHPLDPVINELQRDYGDILVDLSQAERRQFVEALLDSEPNRLAGAFREMLYRQTRGHPLFTSELLRGLQERGDLVKDKARRWVEGPALDWETLPARVEAVIAERISRLDQPLQAALQVACVEGETFTAEVLARVRATGELAMLEALSGELDRRHRLIRAQSIQRLGGRLVSSYRFQHILTQKYLYSTLDEVQRVHLHEQVGTALEELYGAQEQLAAIAVQLALHFQKAKQTAKAVHYLRWAGDRAAELSAYAEAIALLTRGLALLLTLPDSPERALQELALQISLGIASKGSLPGPVGERAFIRARELCHLTGERSQLCRVLGELLIFPYVRAEHQQAREIGEEALTLAQQANDALLVALGHWHLGFIYFALGEFTTARDHLGKMIAFYEPERHRHLLISVGGSDAGLSALAYDACCLWCLGYPEQALRRGQHALALARDLGHAFSQADVVCFGGCLLDSMRHDAQALKVDAEALTHLSRRMGFSSFLGTGTSYQGMALAMQGRVLEGIEQIRQGMAARESVGAHCYSSGILLALAQAQAEAGQPEEGLATLAQVRALVEGADERYCESELHRVRADIMIILGDVTEAEASLHSAVKVAQRQNAKSWELRATTSLARLWQAQGRVGDAREMLAEIHGWFSEGWDTPDLQQAKVLLDELR
ncbi:MAG: AAA family ATPase [Anaerolineae bacterium]|nr:AAA family ATPase [Anaerolineae bacterium]